MWARIKRWLGLRPLAAQFWDTTPPRREEVTTPSPFLKPAIDKIDEAIAQGHRFIQASGLHPAPPRAKFTVFDRAATDPAWAGAMRDALEQAGLEKRAVAYGELIGCSREEIDRTIQQHKELARTTPYQLNWNRVRDDLLATVYPHSTLGRSYAAKDDEQRDT